MRVRGLQNDLADTPILRFDRALVRHRATHHLAEQITDTFQPGRRLDMTHRPLHRTRLHDSRLTPVQIDDQLATAHTHLGGEIRGRSIQVADRQIPLPFIDGEITEPRQQVQVVVGIVAVEVVDSHAYSFICTDPRLSEKLAYGHVRYPRIHAEKQLTADSDNEPKVPPGQALHSQGFLQEDSIWPRVLRCLPVAW